MSERYPITVHFHGIDHTMTIDAARELMRDIRGQIDALKVKCPTCRCRILPDSACSCCNEPDVPDLLELP